MNPKHSASRRKFLVSAPGAIGGVTALGTVSAVTVAGCATAPRIDRQLVFGSLADASKELDRLAKAADLRPGSDWNWPQTLVHCAQSIEYSLTGFPQMKSAVFQRTIGAAAFSVFSWRGRMTHDLAEPIPGAPELDPKVEVRIERDCRYDAALALACGDEDAQREAVTLFSELGAPAAAERVRELLRAAGVRAIPTGPRASTLAAGGLTERESEILAFLAEGLSSADIAARVHRSVRTIAHHVAAVCAKLGADGRLAAVAIARTRGLLER